MLLPFFCSRLYAANVFGRMHYYLVRIIVYWQDIIRAGDSAPHSESAKFRRLQLRLRLPPKRSTPTDSNSCFTPTPQPWAWPLPVGQLESRHRQSGHRYLNLKQPIKHVSQDKLVAFTFGYFLSSGHQLEPIPRHALHSHLVAQTMGVI